MASFWRNVYSFKSMYSSFVLMVFSETLWNVLYKYFLWPYPLLVGIRLPKGPITLNMAVWPHSVAHGNSWLRSGIWSWAKESRTKENDKPKPKRRLTQRWWWWRRWGLAEKPPPQSLHGKSLYWGKCLSCILNIHFWSYCENKLMSVFNLRHTHCSFMPNSSLHPAPLNHTSAPLNHTSNYVNTLDLKGPLRRYVHCF